MANQQTFSDPVAISKDTAAGLGLSSLDMRRGLGALSHPAPGGAVFGNVSGVFPGGTTGSGQAALYVYPYAGRLASWMNGGHYASDRGGGSLYLGSAYGAWWQDHDPAHATFPRYDLVVIRLRDPGVDGTGLTDSAYRTTIKGDPAGTPTRPTTKMETGDVLLATVLIRAGATSLLASDITDERRYVVARGGIVPRTPADTRPGAYEGQFGYNVYTKDLEVWNGTKWDPVATSSAWNTYTPSLRSSAGDVGLGSNARRVGKFSQIGKRLDFNIFFKWGDPPWNGGYGQVYTYLPPGMYGGRDNQWVNCHLWSNNSAFNGDFPGQALIVARDNRIQPFFMRKNTDGNNDPFVISNPAAKPGSGTPSIYAPAGYAEGGELTISGSIEVELA